MINRYINYVNNFNKLSYQYVVIKKRYEIILNKSDYA